jgi:hypothetical protein
VGNKWSKTKIDLEQLRKEIRVMSRDSRLYKLLQEELIGVGHWKQKRRGNPEKAFRVLNNRRI